MRYLSFVLLPALILLNANAGADTLWLQNGEQFQGSAQFLDAGQLVFKSKSAGRISVKWSEIKTLSTDEPVQLEWQDTLTPMRSRLQAAEGGHIKLEDGRQIALTDIRRLVRPRELGGDWRSDGNLDLELDLERDFDDTSDQLDANLDTRLLNHRWRHTLKADYEYESEENETTENNYTVEYFIDRFWTRQWFLRAHSRFERNFEEQDLLNREYGGGAGYQFRDDLQGRFSLSSELVHFDYRRKEFEPDDLIPTRQLKFNALGLSWDFLQNLASTAAELYTNGDAYRPYSIAANYIFYSESGVRYHLSQRVRLSLRVEYDEVRVDELRYVDSRYLFGVGVDW
ncbi:MAG TPA: DUF481 domain-containing protein [Dongiaceae bacterium]|nr:DUF481 domain-containing protein [Dongiaceae bacterium]